MSGTQLISEKPTPERPLTGRAVTRRKLRVDEAHRLDLAALRREGFFRHPAGTTWSSAWWWGFATEPTSTVSYMRLDGADGPQAVVLCHRQTPDSEERPTAFLVRLLVTRPYYGGRRYWWECPGVVAGRPCRRRCRILYRPVGGKFFLCRQCWRLSYSSRQRHRDTLHEGWRRLRADKDALDRCADPRCGTRRKVKAILRAARSEPVIAALSVIT